MKIEKQQLGAKLLKIAAKVEALSMQASKEPESYRLLGRQARDQYAVCEAIVNGAKSGDSIISTIITEPIGQILLQFSICEVSMRMWEEIWNGAHPDRFGLAWEGEDFVLISVWREKVRAMIKACHQEAILTITVEEYFNQLIAAGDSEEDAEALIEWILDVQVGYTRST
jgi:hypothetical protein